MSIQRTHSGFRRYTWASDSRIESSWTKLTNETDTLVESLGASQNFTFYQSTDNFQQSNPSHRNFTMHRKQNNPQPAVHSFMQHFTRSSIQSTCEFNYIMSSSLWYLTPIETLQFIVLLTILWIWWLDVDALCCFPIIVGVCRGVCGDFTLTVDWTAVCVARNMEKAGDWL